MATITEIAGTKQQKKILRTAAYCRVSSDSLDQLHSFAAQVQHYTKAISQNPSMELADIYADEGLTGTKTDKRDDFNRLIADCRKGKIDRVLTKSVSRFARNTVDSLMYARMLKEYGVSILFEKENIDTAYMSSELLLALSGAQAQEESISISKNMRWSVERRMKNGTYLSSSTPYGYKLEEGEFKVVETEAEIVRLIFKSYLSGMGKKAIAAMLNRMDAPKRFGYTTWRISTINYILSNERYIGDALFQKRYTTDTLPFKMKINRGQKPQYYVEDMNPPIITKEVFEAAQKLKAKSTTEERFSVQERPLREKIKCGCGHIYKPITVNGKIYWECRMHNFDSQKCSSRRIPETDIYEAFITMVNKLRNCYEEILPPAIAQTMFVAAMKSGHAADAVILGAAIVLILFISFALRQKRWFALAAVSAVVEALFLTARLWNSRTWWIYLLAAGVILTAAGVSGEALKRKSGGEKSKLAKMMSEWRW